MRSLLWVAGGLVLLAGVQLFVFPDRTDRWFAWTVEPPLTAAFLGAAYWSAVAVEWSAARASTWTGARIAVPAVFVFTSLTFTVTLVHLDRFHLDGEHAAETRAVTWIWVVVYATVPVIMVALWFFQSRGHPTATLRRTQALPNGLTVLVAAQAVVLAIAGVLLLVAPRSAGDFWPWPLTPLTARAVGAWLVGLAVAATHALIERDLSRVRPAAMGYLVFGVLQAAALFRFRNTPDWNDMASWAYTAFLASTVVTGATALRNPSRVDLDAAARDGVPSR